MKIRYFHQAFLDTAQSLINEFRDDNSNTLIILGAHEMLRSKYSYDELIKGYDKVIIYNLENYFWLKSRDEFDEFICLLHKCDEVWDYDEENISLFNQHNISPKLHILKPYMNWNMYAKVDKDIDILIYGSMTEHRTILIEFLKRKYNIVALDNVHGSNLDSYIMRSKILLNVHSYYDGVQMGQEQARMVKWIGAPCQIISEKSRHNYLNVPEMEYWELFCI